MGLRGAKMSPRRASRASAPKMIYTNCVFPMQKPYYSSLGGSQDAHKRFRKASKRHLKSFRTSKRTVPKRDPTNINLLTNFGADLGPEMDPKMEQKLHHEWNQNWNCIW